MASSSRRSVPWIFWPVALLWDFLAFVLGLTGRLIGIALGLILLIVGLVLTVTVVGGVIGVPLIILGFLLLVRSIF